MYVVRDKDGTLKLFNDKPIRDWLWTNHECTEKKEFWARDIEKYPPVHHGSPTSLFDPNYQIFYLDKSQFAKLTWEDEPLKVELVQTYEW